MTCEASACQAFDSVRVALVAARMRGHQREWSYDSLVSKRIGFFIFDGLTGLDLVGPFDTFAVATELASPRKNGHAYDLVTVGLNRKAVVAESGMCFRPDTTILKAPALDTL